MSAPVASVTSIGWQCTVCGTVTQKRCSGCKTVVYCSVDCQKKHRPKHKLACTALGDYLTKRGDDMARVPEAERDCILVLAAKGVISIKEPLSKQLVEDFGMPIPFADAMAKIHRARPTGTSSFVVETPDQIGMALVIGVWPGAVPKSNNQKEQIAV